MRVVAAPYVFTGSQRSLSPTSARGGRGEQTATWITDGALALSGDVVVEVGPRAEVEARYGPAEALDAVVLPALVNAHTHLEVSHLRGKVPSGGGLAGWIARFVRARGETREDPAAVDRAVASLRACGVAAVGDVTNTLAALPALSHAGLVGRLFHEVYGLSEARIAASLRQAEAVRDAAPAPGPGLRIVPSPHAVYSTNPRTVASLLAGGPASIHLAEDPAERAFVTTGEGPLAELMAALGADEVRPRGRSPVACAEGLHAGNLVVHAVDLDDQDIEVLRRTGATAVLCPRSNQHIGGRLPDLPRLLSVGVRLAVGTDSLASSPSLSPFAELAALSRAFPQVAAERLLPLAWNGGCVGAPAVGRLEPGTSPGVISLPLGGERPDDPAAWLLAAAGAEPPFLWIARHRPELPS
jgi:cytosine/adenosine deaminase-related metal-dependent hydrolase